MGQSQILPYLIGLSAHGFQIGICSLEKPERYQENKAQIESMCREAKIEWHPIFYVSKPRFVHSLINKKRVRRKVYELIQSNNIRIIHARSYISAEIALEIKHKTGIPFIFDMRGFWADERVEGGIWNLRNPLFKWLYNYYKKLELKLFKEAAHVVSLTHKGKSVIHSWKGLENIPIKVIPCCADLDFFNYQNQNDMVGKEIRMQLGIPEEALVISYLGSWGTWYLPEEMMIFFSRMLLKRKDAVFLVMTKDDKQAVLNDALKYQIPNESLIIASVKRNDVPAYLAASDLGLFFIKPVFSKQASSPTKMGEMMGLGLPLICNSGVGDVADIMKRANGVIVNTFDIESLDKAIDQALTLVNSEKEINRNCALEIYSLKNGVQSYLEIYKNLLNDDDKDAL